MAWQLKIFFFKKIHFQHLKFALKRIRENHTQKDRHMDIGTCRLIWPRLVADSVKKGNLHRNTGIKRVSSWFVFKKFWLWQYFPVKDKILKLECRTRTTYTLLIDIVFLLPQARIDPDRVSQKNSMNFKHCKEINNHASDSTHHWWL